MKLESINSFIEILVTHIWITFGVWVTSLILLIARSHVARLASVETLPSKVVIFAVIFLIFCTILLIGSAVGKFSPKTASFENCSDDELAVLALIHYSTEDSSNKIFLYKHAEPVMLLLNRRWILEAGGKLYNGTSDYIFTPCVIRGIKKDAVKVISAFSDKKEFKSRVSPFVANRSITINNGEVYPVN